MQRVFHIIRRFWSARIGLAIAFFVVVVGFLDDNSIFNLIRLYAANEDLREQIKHYEKRYDEDTEALELINSSPEAVVQVARVKHWMKNENEDVYIIIEE